MSAGLVDLLGEPFEGLGALLEPPFGRCRARGAEQVPGPDRAVPPAQPVQAFLLLIQLGEGELAFRDLAGQLGLILAAVAQELAPFGLALLGLRLAAIRACCRQRARAPRFCCSRCPMLSTGRTGFTSICARATLSPRTGDRSASVPLYSLSSPSSSLDGDGTFPPIQMAAGSASCSYRLLTGQASGVPTTVPVAYKEPWHARGGR